MSSIEVLIVFHCRTGAGENVALAAAVGAVQARAMIRLRRLPDMDSLLTNEILVRMGKEYVAPTEADIVRANALIFVSPALFAPEAVEWAHHLELLTRLQSEGKLAGKLAAVLGETDASRDALAQIIRTFGFTMVSTDSRNPTSDGRLVASHAAALSANKPSAF